MEANGLAVESVDFPVMKVSVDPSSWCKQASSFTVVMVKEALMSSSSIIVAVAFQRMDESYKKGTLLQSLRIHLLTTTRRNSVGGPDTRCPDNRRRLGWLRLGLPADTVQYR